MKKNGLRIGIMSVIVLVALYAGLTGLYSLFASSSSRYEAEKPVVLVGKARKIAPAEMLARAKELARPGRVFTFAHPIHYSNTICVTMSDNYDVYQVYPSTTIDFGEALAEGNRARFTLRSNSAEVRTKDLRFLSVFDFVEIHPVGS